MSSSKELQNERVNKIKQSKRYIANIKRNIQANIQTNKNIRERQQEQQRQQELQQRQQEREQPQEQGRLKDLINCVNQKNVLYDKYKILKILVLLVLVLLLYFYITNKNPELKISNIIF